MRSSYLISLFALTATAALAREHPRSVLFLAPTQPTMFSQSSSFSSSSVWAPGADGEMHQEVHEVQHQSASDGFGITHFTRGVKACHDGDCSHAVQHGRVVPQDLFTSEAQGTVLDPMRDMMQGMFRAAQVAENQGDDEMFDVPRDVMQDPMEGSPLQSIFVRAMEPEEVTEAETIPEPAAPMNVVKPEEATEAKTTQEPAGPMNVVKPEEVTEAETIPEPAAPMNKVKPEEAKEAKTTQEPTGPMNVVKSGEAMEDKTTAEPAAPIHVVKSTATLSSGPHQVNTDAGMAEMMSLES